MANRPDSRRASDELSEKILSFPETHMGVQTVALVLRDGGVVEPVEIAWGREVIRVTGNDARTIDWGDVVNVLDRSGQLGDELSARAPRRATDPPAAGAMRYQRVAWRHDSSDEPVVLYTEVDSDGFENRKVDEYRNGRLARVDRIRGSGSTFVSGYFIPDLDAINAEAEFSATLISPEDFEDVWRRASPEP